VILVTSKIKSVDNWDCRKGKSFNINNARVEVYSEASQKIQSVLWRKIVTKDDCEENSSFSNTSWI